MSDLSMMIYRTIKIECFIYSIYIYIIQIASLVGALEHFLFFHIIIGNVIIPTDELIFFRGVGSTTNQLPFWEPTILINLGLYSSIYPNNWWEQFYSSIYPILGFITSINLGNNHVNIMGHRIG